jgi:hypothetical protein
VAVPGRSAAHGRQALPAFSAAGPEFGGGIRHRTSADVHARPGWEFFHAIVDDHSRLAYGELLADERAPTVTAFTERALAWSPATASAPGG